MKNFLIRAVTGVLFVIVLITGILNQSLFYCILFAIITALGLIEFYKLINKTTEKSKINIFPAVISGTYFFIASYLYIAENQSPHFFLPYLLYLILIFICEIYSKNENPIYNIACTVFGQFYIVLPFALFNLMFIPVALTGDPENMSENLYLLFSSLSSGALFPLCFFIFIWLNDTGAYLAGVTLGKHKLFKRISPAKSWEGFFGGVILDIIVAIVLSQIFPVMPVLYWIGFALIVIVAGTYGDLWESLIKRTVGVKDSGKFLPGHGGLLDRFDSALVGIPASILYLYLVL